MNIEKELLKLSLKALKLKEIPVAALIIKDNVIISKAYNKRHTNKDVLKHAEIIAITKATKKLKDWRLNNCELYTTLEPCEMCKAVIKESRIKKVYYYVSKTTVYQEKIEYKKVNSQIAKQYKKILKKSFKNIRI